MLFSVSYRVFHYFFACFYLFFSILALRYQKKHYFVFRGDNDFFGVFFGAPLSKKSLSRAALSQKSLFSRQGSSVREASWLNHAMKVVETNQLREVS